MLTDSKSLNPAATLKFIRLRIYESHIFELRIKT